ncbi:hypothetical protein E2C01_050358 [Portunus trituberculatus]|uniref:Uncharacterized protein n=1 Tax=Portunus trituberculatus TaxID=210409 RepID=A0A5B7GH34_PORTR|nr:hypothetical protein [Portunus trituberculatus]
MMVVDESEGDDDGEEGVTTLTPQHQLHPAHPLRGTKHLSELGFEGSTVAAQVRGPCPSSRENPPSPPSRRPLASSPLRHLVNIGFT